MNESPLQLKDLELTFVEKGTPIICYQCGQPTTTGVNIQLAKDEVLLCGECASANNSLHS